MRENEIPFNSDNIIDVDVHKKSPLKIILVILGSLAIITYILILIFSFTNVLPQEDHIDIDNSTNYIKAIYKCNSHISYRYKFYDDENKNYSLLISSIIVDGENVSVTPYHEYSDCNEKNVEIKFKDKVENLTYFFSTDFLISVDFSKLDTSELNDMSYMFFHSSYLKSITWGGNFSTSKVTMMDYLFYYCYSLTSLNLSIFKTPKVTTFSNMFYSCYSIKELDLTSFDTSSATDLAYMFGACTSLTSVDVSKFDTSKVVTMYGMFVDCKVLKSLDLSNFKTKALEDATMMFRNCEELVNIENHFTSEKLKTAQDMLSECANLRKIDLSGFVGEELTNVKFMFYDCYNLTLVDMSNFECGKCNETNGMFTKILSSGTFIYNSSKINPKILEQIPEKWNKTDIKN